MWNKGKRWWNKLGQGPSRQEHIRAASQALSTQQSSHQPAPTTVTYTYTTLRSHSVALRLRRTATTITTATSYSPRNCGVRPKKGTLLRSSSCSIEKDNRRGRESSSSGTTIDCSLYCRTTMYLRSSGSESSSRQLGVSGTQLASSPIILRSAVAGHEATGIS